MTKRTIDHLVYAVPDLEIAIDWFEEKTGIRPTFGGYHGTKGTKNAVLHLGNNSYLEILAADDTNTNIQPPRWMGIDVLTAPKLTRWAIKSTNLEQDSVILKQYHTGMGEIQGGQRQMTNGKLLKWEMILPLAKPEVDVIPFMTDWQQSETHPTEQLEEYGRLLGLSFTHPNPARLRAVLAGLLLDIEVVKGAKMSIKARIETPKGIVEI